MMGALIDLGKGNITLQDIKDSLLAESTVVMDYIAPASGLFLNKIEFD
jgi:tRNA pseudouridine38-40 synthase